MIELGMTSNYFEYSSANSAYNSTQVSYIKSKQDSSDESTLPKISSDNDIEDKAIISDEAKALSQEFETNVEKKLAENNQENTNLDKSAQNKQDSTEKTDKSQKSEDELTPEEKQQVAELKARDAEVRAHEQAHIAAAAGINASAPSYNYQEGPDGQKYAVGGEVSLSCTQGGDPETDLANAQTLKAAALAPAEPSGQDYSVASNADKMIADAKERIAKEKEMAQAQNETPKTEQNNSVDSSNIATNNTTQQNTTDINAIPAYSMIT